MLRIESIAYFIIRTKYVGCAIDVPIGSLTIPCNNGVYHRN